MTKYPTLPSTTSLFPVISVNLTLLKSGIDYGAMLLGATEDKIEYAGYQGEISQLAYDVIRLGQVIDNLQGIFAACQERFEKQSKQIKSDSHTVERLQYELQLADAVYREQLQTAGLAQQEAFLLNDLIRFVSDWEKMINLFDSVSAGV